MVETERLRSHHWILKLHGENVIRLAISQILTMESRLSTLQQYVYICDFFIILTYTHIHHLHMFMQNNISRVYFSLTNTTWWNRHNWAGVGTSALCWSILWMEIYDCALGNDSPCFVGKCWKCGCWRMETHENIARVDVMLLFFGGWGGAMGIWIRNLPNQPWRWKTFWELKLLQRLGCVYRI